MVSFYRWIPIGDKHYGEGFCNSDDTKPTEGITQGSILVEVDTGNVSFFNEESEEWVEQFSFQG